MYEKFGTTVNHDAVLYSTFIVDLHHSRAMKANTCWKHNYQTYVSIWSASSTVSWSFLYNSADAIEQFCWSIAGSADSSLSTISIYISPFLQNPLSVRFSRIVITFCCLISSNRIFNSVAFVGTALSDIWFLRWMIGFIEESYSLSPPPPTVSHYCIPHYIYYISKLLLGSSSISHQPSLCPLPLVSQEHGYQE